MKPKSEGTSAPGSARSAEWQQRDRIWNSALPHVEKNVLDAFLDHDRLARGREVWPSLERIAWRIGLANSTVRQAVRELETRGILERVGYYLPDDGAPRGRVSKWRVHLDRAPTRPSWAAGRRQRQAAAGADRRRKTAPVDAATGAGRRPDRRRNAARQAPAAGAERRKERRKELRAAPSAPSHHKKPSKTTLQQLDLLDGAPAGMPTALWPDDGECIVPQHRAQALTALADACESGPVITKLAHDAIDRLGPKHEDLVEAVKAVCAKNGIPYSTAVVYASIASAEAQRAASTTASEGSR